MRILNEDTNEKIDRILLLLTVNEANELSSSLHDIIDTPANNHTHIPSEDYKKEVTVCIYGTEIANKFSERISMLIKDDR
jgi:hypothetical protein